MLVGHEGLLVPEPEHSSTSFGWYGEQYSQNDLVQALALMCGPEDRYGQLLEQDSYGCRASANWRSPDWQKVFNSDALLLLDRLATFPLVCMLCTSVNTSVIASSVSALQSLLPPQYLDLTHALSCYASDAVLKFTVPYAMPY